MGKNFKNFKEVGVRPLGAKGYSVEEEGRDRGGGESTEIRYGGKCHKESDCFVS